MTALAARRIYSAAEVSAMGLSARSADLLTTIGMPRREAPYFAATALTPFSIRGSRRPAAVNKGSLVRVGVWDRASFVVDVVSDAVWFVAPDSPGERPGSASARFVNSHLDTYLACLQHARSVLKRSPSEWAQRDRKGELVSVRLAFHRGPLGVSPASGLMLLCCWSLLDQAAEVRNGV